MGALIVKRFANLNVHDYEKLFDANVRSAVLACTAVLPAMRAAHFGRIVALAAMGRAKPALTVVSV